MTTGGATPVFQVVDGGLLTTVQDLGRPGHVHEGVPRSGAADGLSLAIANVLAGNPAGDAALEIAVGGLRLRVLRPVTIGLGGADLGASIASAGTGAAPRLLKPGRSHSLGEGEELAVEGRPADGLGCRAYLAVPGGVDVPEVLGSRSTSLVGSFGGFDGRPLRPGDVLLAGPSTLERPAVRLPAELPIPSPAQRIRVLAVASDERGRSTTEALARRAWTVAGDSDRRGLRLLPASGVSASDGRDREPTAAADRPSEPVTPGTIQLTPSGQPLVLMPDAGTTGGYAVAAVVIAADVPILGQLGPWDEVRFRLVDLATASAAEHDRRRLLEAIRASVDVAHRAD